jgi:heme/copper-type cytochrome/quinol oxidase subunit 2
MPDHAAGADAVMAMMVMVEVLIVLLVVIMVIVLVNIRDRLDTLQAAWGRGRPLIIEGMRAW